MSAVLYPMLAAIWGFVLGHALAAREAAEERAKAARYEWMRAEAATRREMMLRTYTLETIRLNGVLRRRALAKKRPRALPVPVKATEAA